MTVKNVFVKDTYGNIMGLAYVKETYGGQEIDIQMSHELSELTKWWKEWGPIFSSGDPRVVDALLQAKTMHALTKEQ